MELIGFILGVAITGLIVGALGRLAIPGPNPMSWGQTILVGLGGAFAGGFVGYLLGVGPGLRFLLQVLAAAGIVWFMEKRRAPAA